MQKYAEGVLPLGLINSSNCRKLYGRMQRYMENHVSEASHPNMSSLFEGTLAQRRHLLQQRLSSGEVADAAESNLSVAKTNEKELKGQEKLLTVEGMRRNGVSEHLRFEIDCCIF